ncbi:MAG: ATP-binding protein [Deltaproteobacteria bacterium]|nr:ATP-binding protein [Deltaproteobacteria bacterium]
MGGGRALINIIPFTTWEILENYFFGKLSATSLPGRKYLTAILEMTPDELNGALTGTLERIGFFFNEEYEWQIGVNKNFLSFLLNPDENLLAKKFFTRLTGPALPLDRHPIDKEQTDHLLALLKQSVPTFPHILFYGEPGTGKTSYARGLVRTLKQTGYQIVRDE